MPEIQSHKLSNPSILLLHPHNVLEKYHHPIPQVAFGYLSAALKKNGYSRVSVKDALLYKWSAEQLLAYVLELQPDIICIRVWSHQVPVATEYCRLIRKYLPNAIFIFGGPHVTVAPESAAMNCPADFLIAGEAEEGLPLLVDYICGKRNNLEDIPGLVRKTFEKIVVQSLSNVVELDRFEVDWNNLGLTDYHNLRKQTTAYDCDGKRNAYIFTTRGCPYPCTYCAAGITNGKKIRAHSPERMLRDIKLLYHDYGVRHFNIMDDNFTFYKDVVMGFCNEFLKYRPELPGITFHNPNGVRVDRLDDEILATMKECGWRWLHIGLESGSPDTLKRMRKKLNLEIARTNIEKIRAHGMKCWGFFMLGYLDETREDMEKTIRFATESSLSAATFSLFSPIPGTTVFKEMVERGMIPPDFISSSYMTAKQTTFAKDVSPAQLQSILRMALLRFYSRPDRAMYLVSGMSWDTFWNRVATFFFTPQVAKSRI